MPSTTFIGTIRHAHTEYNAQRRYAGSLDVPLSELGVRQARVVAPTIQELAFDVILCSPQARAQQTAQIFTSTSGRIITEPLCCERKFGVMEGLTWDEVCKLEPQIMMIQVGHDLHTVNPRGGEPFEDVWDRARKLRNRILSEFSGLRVLVVSHGVFLQLFNGLLSGLSCIESLARYPGNLELSTFSFEDQRLAETQMLKLANGEIVRW